MPGFILACTKNKPVQKLLSFVKTCLWIIDLILLHLCCMISGRQWKNSYLFCQVWHEPLLQSFKILEKSTKFFHSWIVFQLFCSFKDCADTIHILRWRNRKIEIQVFITKSYNEFIKNHCEFCPAAWVVNSFLLTFGLEFVNNLGECAYLL